MCSQCHFAIPDEKNRWFTLDGSSHPNWYVRRGIIGLGADVVKRASVYTNATADNSPQVSGIPTAVLGDSGEIADPASSLSSSGLPVGYDVHFDRAKGNLSCLSCHGEENLSEDEQLKHNPHNFLKGNDPAGEVSPELDYNPSLKKCSDCHWGSDEEAANAHTAYFGPSSETHISKIMCQVCHIPYKTYWTFRFFDDTLAYSNQFDDRFKEIDPSTGTVSQFPPEWAIPAFGPTPTYGLNYSFVIAQTDDNGIDTLAPITQIDMDPFRAAMRYNNPMFGAWSKVVFPFRWAPAIVPRWTVNSKGEPVKKFGLISPIGVATWIDASTGKALFIREMNKALMGSPAGVSTIDPEHSENATVPSLTIDPSTGKIAVKLITGKYIDDDNGDFVPEIDTDEEYYSMKNALTQVLNEEDPGHPHNPVILFFLAPFGIDHGVWPADLSLGSHDQGHLSCNACHNPDPAKNRLSPEVAAGNPDAGREISFIPFTFPQAAIDESKSAGYFKVPELKTITDKNGRKEMVFTQGELVKWFNPVNVESKDYKGFADISPYGGVFSSDGITISVPKGAVQTPTLISIKKVDSTKIVDAALQAATSYGITSPLLGGDIVNITTKTNRFSSPVQITLKYDPSRISGRGILLSSEDGINWNRLTEFDISSENPYITFATQKLSYFAIVGTTSPSTPSGKVTSGGGGGGCSISPCSSTGSLLSVFIEFLPLLFIRRRKK